MSDAAGDPPPEGTTYDTNPENNEETTGDDTVSEDTQEHPTAEAAKDALEERDDASIEGN